MNFSELGDSNKTGDAAVSDAATAGANNPMEEEPVPDVQNEDPPDAFEGGGDMNAWNAAPESDDASIPAAQTVPVTSAMSGVLTAVEFVAYVAIAVLGAGFALESSSTLGRLAMMHRRKFIVAMCTMIVIAAEARLISRFDAGSMMQQLMSAAVIMTTLVIGGMLSLTPAAPALLANFPPLPPVNPMPPPSMMPAPMNNTNRRSPSAIANAVLPGPNSNSNRNRLLSSA